LDQAVAAAGEGGAVRRQFPERRGDYYCRRLGPHLSWTGDLGEMSFHETRDTGS